MMKLNGVAIFVKDMAGMVAFYRDVVGFPIEWDGADPFVCVERDSLRLMLFGRADFAEGTNQKYTYPSGLNGTFQLALDVDTEEEVDVEYHRVVSKGAASIIEPKTYPWGLRSCFVADPEGNLIEIATWNSTWKNQNA